MKNSIPFTGEARLLRFKKTNADFHEPHPGESHQEHLSVLAGKMTDYATIQKEFKDLNRRLKDAHQKLPRERQADFIQRANAICAKLKTMTNEKGVQWNETKEHAVDSKEMLTAWRDTKQQLEHFMDSYEKPRTKPKSASTDVTGKPLPLAESPVTTNKLKPEKNPSPAPVESKTKSTPTAPANTSASRATKPLPPVAAPSGTRSATAKTPATSTKPTEKPATARPKPPAALETAITPKATPSKPASGPTLPNTIEPQTKKWMSKVGMQFRVKDSTTGVLSFDPQKMAFPDGKERWPDIEGPLNVKVRFDENEKKFTIENNSTIFQKIDDHDESIGIRPQGSGRIGYFFKTRHQEEKDYRKALNNKEENAFRCSSLKVRDNLKIAKEAIGQNPENIVYSPAACRDRDLMLFAIKTHLEQLKTTWTEDACAEIRAAATSFTGDREFAKTIFALEKKTIPFSFFSPELRKDPDIIKAALRCSSDYVKDADLDVLKTPALLEFMANECPNKFEFLARSHGTNFDLEKIVNEEMARKILHGKDGIGAFRSLLEEKTQSPIHAKLLKTIEEAYKDQNFKEVLMEYLHLSGAGIWQFPFLHANQEAVLTAMHSAPELLMHDWPFVKEGQKTEWYREAIARNGHAARYGASEHVFDAMKDHCFVTVNERGKETTVDDAKSYQLMDNAVLCDCQLFLRAKNTDKYLYQGIKDKTTNVMTVGRIKTITHPNDHRWELKLESGGITVIETKGTQIEVTIAGSKKPFVYETAASATTKPALSPKPASKADTTTNEEAESMKRLVNVTEALKDIALHYDSKNLSSTQTQNMRTAIDALTSSDKNTLLGVIEGWQARGLLGQGGLLPFDEETKDKDGTIHLFKNSKKFEVILSPDGKIIVRVDGANIETNKLSSAVPKPAPAAKPALKPDVSQEITDRFVQDLHFPAAIGTYPGNAFNLNDEKRKACEASLRTLIGIPKDESLEQYFQKGKKEFLSDSGELLRFTNIQSAGDTQILRSTWHKTGTNESIAVLTLNTAQPRLIVTFKDGMISSIDQQRDPFNVWGQVATEHKLALQEFCKPGSEKLQEYYRRRATCEKDKSSIPAFEVPEKEVSKITFVPTGEAVIADLSTPLGTDHLWICTGLSVIDRANGRHMLAHVNGGSNANGMEGADKTAMEKVEKAFEQLVVDKSEITIVIGDKEENIARELFKLLTTKYLVPPERIRIIPPRYIVQRNGGQRGEDIICAPEKGKGIYRAIEWVDGGGGWREDEGDPVFRHFRKQEKKWWEEQKNRNKPPMDTKLTENPRATEKKPESKEPETTPEKRMAAEHLQLLNSLKEKTEDKLLDYITTETIRKHQEDGTLYVLLLAIDSKKAEDTTSADEYSRMIEALINEGMALRHAIAEAKNMTISVLRQKINTAPFAEYFTQENKEGELPKANIDLKHLEKLSEPQLRTLYEICLLEQQVRKANIRYQGGSAFLKNTISATDPREGRYGNCNAVASYYYALASLVGSKELTSSMNNFIGDHHIQLYFNLGRDNEGKAIMLSKNTSRVNMRDVGDDGRWRSPDDHPYPHNFYDPKYDVHSHGIDLEKVSGGIHAIVGGRISILKTVKAEFDKKSITMLEHDRKIYEKVLKLHPYDITNSANYWEILSEMYDRNKEKRGHLKNQTGKALGYHIDASYWAGFPLVNYVERFPEEGAAYIKQYEQKITKNPQTFRDFVQSPIKEMRATPSLDRRKSTDRSSLSLNIVNRVNMIQALENIFSEPKAKELCNEQLKILHEEIRSWK